MEEVSPLEQAQMDADDQLPDYGYWEGLVWRKRLAKVLRHWTLQQTPAPVAPIVIPLGHKIIRTATQMHWKRDGSLYFERRDGRLFMAVSPGGEYKIVPDWTLLVLQDLPETVEQLQSPKPLYIAEPGRQRKRKATDGETQIAAMVCLRKIGKTWEDIAAMLGLSRKETEKSVKEIERVYRDIQQMAEREKVDLDQCHVLNPEWIAHNEPEVRPRWSNRNPGKADPVEDDDEE
jgi:hypothetical protein